MARDPRAALRRRLGPAVRHARAARLRWWLRVSAAPVGAVLVYHETTGARPESDQVVPVITAAALGHHARHVGRAYRPVLASEFLAAVGARRRGGRIPVAITFDDDLASHVDIALPLLERHGCGASFFLTGAGLDAPHGFWWQRLQTAVDRGLDPRPALTGAGVHAPDGAELADVAAAVEREPLTTRAALSDALAELIGEDPAAHRLTRVQAASLARAGFEIGFHTREHPVLPQLDDAELAEALRVGRSELEGVAGRALTAVAYPHGRADERVAAAAREAGFTAGFGGADRSHANPLLIGRTELLIEDPSTFALVLAAELRAQR